LEGPVDPDRRGVKLSTAPTNRQQDNPSDKRLDNPTPRVKGQPRPLGLQVAASQGLRKLRGTEGAELVVQQAELAVQAGSHQLVLMLVPSSIGLVEHRDLRKRWHAVPLCQLVGGGPLGEPVGSAHATVQRPGTVPADLPVRSGWVRV
jgi:hypothetical protein